MTALMFSSLVLMTVNLLRAEEIMALTLKSSAFDNGGEIPSRYTCEGEDVSPSLVWTDVPETARSLVLIIDDPDAPDPKAPKMTWVHWVLYNIPPDVTGLPEGVVPAKLSPGMMEGLNDWKRIGYGGPCPPGGTHRYFFKLYALDINLNLGPGKTKSELLKAIEGHILAESQLMGKYSR